MISLTCTTCSNVLSIDDAFAGGVCRCQHCGTIQTVPAHLKRGGAPGEGLQAKGAKTLYKTRQRGDIGTGLDDLAGAVATSSGLARGDLRKRQAQPEEK